MYVVSHPVESAILIGFFLLIAFPVHEFFHAYAAYRLGDGTARLFGRLTLNPIKHFHPIGGSMLVISVLLTGIPLGFAATPVNPANLRGRYGDAVVGLAGPVSNLLLAMLFAFPLRLLLADATLLIQYPRLFEILDLIVWGNVILGVFNLVPVPPLDGGRVLLSVLPYDMSRQLRPVLYQYGLFIVVLVMFAGGRILVPIADAIYNILVGA